MSDIDYYKNQFLDFIDKDFPQNETYHQQLRKTFSSPQANHTPRLLINLDHLRQFDPKLAEDLLCNKEKSQMVLVGFENGICDVITREFSHILLNSGPDSKIALDTVSSQTLYHIDQFHIGFHGHFGSKSVSPRQLLSHLLNCMVACEGIVTKVSVSNPELMQSVHYCPTNGKILKRNYRSETSILGLATATSFPTRDEEGNPLEMEFGLSKYRDKQKIYLQEMPERAPAGQLPRSVEVDVEDDLVDAIKPGDRIRVIGLFRAVSGRSLGSRSSGTLKTVISANNIEKLSHDVQLPSMDDIKQIRRAAKREDIFDALADSIAPSICGHDMIKKALLLQLVGGLEKNLEHGTHLRGDVNILVVGDPGTAKSQMLRFMLHLSPLSISTSGRASTGVGLTAAVVPDASTGERTLQAGAMVLADRGLVCVDEFDKMNEEDRTAMHEVMEQQTVTIQKAGIHTTLNARCSVLAAANPLYGHYHPKKSIQHNVNLPDSLLSRFDLVFILIDQKDQYRDREISEHVLSMHRYRGPDVTIGLQSSTQYIDPKDVGIIPVSTQGANGSVSVGEETHSNFTTTFGGRRYTVDFLRKFVTYAKMRVRPELQDEAMRLIEEKYVALRANILPTTVPITARALETLVRLSTAHAKCRLSKSVTVEDVNAAFEVFQFAVCFDTSTSSHAKPSEIGDDEAEITFPTESITESEKDQTENQPTFSNNIGPTDDDDRLLREDETTSRKRKRETQESSGDTPSKKTKSSGENEEESEQIKTSSSSNVLDSVEVARLVNHVLKDMIQKNDIENGFVTIDDLFNRCQKLQSRLTKDDVINCMEDLKLLTGDQFFFDDQDERLYLAST